MPEQIANAETPIIDAPRKLHLLAIMAITIIIAAAPLFAARAFYSSEGISRNVFVTQLVLPFVYLMASLAVVLLVARTGVLGNLEISWWRDDSVGETC